MAANLYGIQNAQIKNKEKETIQSITNYLNEDWHVVVPPTFVGREVDIVILNNHFLTFVEIKSSEVTFESGDIKQLNRQTGKRHKIDPIKQLERLFRVVIDQQEEIFDSNQFIPKNYFLCTPESHDAGIPEDFGDKNNKRANFNQISISELNDDLTKYLQKCSRNFKTPLNKNEIKEIINKFIPLKDKVSSTQNFEKFIYSKIKEATNSQKTILRMIGNTKQFSVIGGAGTGKTVVATETFRRRVKDDPSKKYIFACYTNRLYEEFLKKELPKNTFGGTIASLLQNKIAPYILRSVDIEYSEFSDYIKTHKNNEFNHYFESYQQEYEAFVLSTMLQTTLMHQNVRDKYLNTDQIDFQKMQDELISILKIDSDKLPIAHKIKNIILDNQISLESTDLEVFIFDGVFCDEAQDISPPWFLFFSNLILSPNYEAYLFYDMNQKVLGRSEFINPLSTEPIDLNLSGNCRSTDQITIFANLVIESIQDLVLRGIFGKNVSLKQSSDINFLCEAIDYEIQELIAGGVKEKEIAILYDKKNNSEIAAQVNQFFEKKYLHIQQHGGEENPGNIDSIRRFKGLEKKYVFLVVSSSDFSNNKKLIYVGATRASIHLNCMVLINDKFNFFEFEKKYIETLDLYNL